MAQINSLEVIQMFIALLIVLLLSIIVAYGATLFEYETLCYYSTNIVIGSFLSIMLYIVVNIFYRVFTA
jgi:hypothetical protein